MDGEIYLVNRTMVSGEESVAESGDVFTEQGKVDMLFTGAHFGTSDYAVTVALRQLAKACRTATRRKPPPI